MARIRSDKPEAYQSETLAEISIAAERTFKGMATIADDRGRLADKPAQINGELWSMRGGHTKDDLESELDEMVKVDLVCRYTGCDGKRYLHMVTWDQHQKIDRPSKSRLPRCPHHRLPDPKLDYCGLHEGECIRRDMPGDPRDASPDSRGDASRAREGSRDLQPDETGHDSEPRTLASSAGDAVPDTEEVDTPPTARTSPEQGKRKSSRQSREPSMQDRGSRTVDLGSLSPLPPSDLHAELAAAVPGTTERETQLVLDLLAARPGVRSAPAVLKTEIRGGTAAALVGEVRRGTAADFAPIPGRYRRLAHCGDRECNEQTRRREDPDTGDDLGPCLKCSGTEDRRLA